MERLLFLGVGPLARAIRAAAPPAPATGTSRRPPDARFGGGLAHADPADEPTVARAAEGAHVVVTFPPDGATDARLARTVRGARAIVYASSTAVYGSGVIDEATPVTTRPSEAQARRLEAEAAWRGVGASVVRLPALYGPEIGLHLRLAAGTFTMPGDGGAVVSRVHTDDAAAFCLAALAATPGSLLVTGDDEPAPIAEVVELVCRLFALPPPPRGAEADAHRTLRGRREVDSRPTRARFGVTLRFPTYREGYEAIRAAQVGSGESPARRIIR